MMATHIVYVACMSLQQARSIPSRYRHSLFLLNKRISLLASYESIDWSSNKIDFVPSEADVSSRIMDNT